MFDSTREDSRPTFLVCLPIRLVPVGKLTYPEYSKPDENRFTPYARQHVIYGIVFYENQLSKKSSG